MDNNPKPQNFISSFIIAQLMFGINHVGSFVELTQNNTEVNSEVSYKLLRGGLPILKTDFEVTGFQAGMESFVNQAK